MILLKPAQPTRKLPSGQKQTAPMTAAAHTIDQLTVFLVARAKLPGARTGLHDALEVIQDKKTAPALEFGEQRGQLLVHALGQPIQALVGHGL